MLVSLLARSSDKTLITFKIRAGVLLLVFFSLQQHLCHIFVCWHLRTSSAASWLVKCEQQGYSLRSSLCGIIKTHPCCRRLALKQLYFHGFIFWLLDKMLRKATDSVPACDWTWLNEPSQLGCLYFTSDFLQVCLVKLDSEGLVASQSTTGPNSILWGEGGRTCAKFDRD